MMFEYIFSKLAEEDKLLYSKNNWDKPEIWIEPERLIPDIKYKTGEEIAMRTLEIFITSSDQLSMTYSDFVRYKREYKLNMIC